MGLSVNCHNINLGLNVCLKVQTHTERRITFIAYATVRWKEEKVQARWNVEEEQNYKKDGNISAAKPKLGVKIKILL